MHGALPQVSHIFLYRAGYLSMETTLPLLWAKFSLLLLN
jgi:hypothetical protein